MNLLTNFSRREFIQAATVFTVTTAAPGAAYRALAAGQPKRWTVACRDVHLKATGQRDCWAALKFLDAPGVEVGVNEDLLCYGLFHPAQRYSLASADGLKTLAEDLATHGARITALCMNNRFDERLDQEIAWAKKVVAVAQQLGVAAIRIDVVPRKVAADQFLPFAIQACKQLCAVAEGTPVRFGIENHGHTTNDPAFLEQLFDGVGSAHLGLTLDAMNFYWFGHPLNALYGIYEKFASRVFHTHCKNLRYPEERKNTRRPVGWEYEKYAAPLYDGDINYPKVAAILRRANYQGDLCLENECLGHFPKEQHAEILKKEIAVLQGLA